MRSSRPVNATAPTENIRYLIDRDLRIPVDAFVAGVDLFIDAVIGRLRTTGYTETALETLWAEVQTERTTAEIAHWRKLEALAGLDPDADDSAFLDALQTQQRQVGPAAIEELLAAFKRDAPAILSDLQDSGRRSATTLTIADIAPLSKRIRAKATTWMSIKQPGDAPPEPWQRAYEAADMARAHWQLPMGRLSNGLLGQLGQSWTHRARGTVAIRMTPFGRQEITAADIAAVTGGLRSDYLTQGPAVPPLRAGRRQRLRRRP